MKNGGVCSVNRRCPQSRLQGGQIMDAFTYSIPTRIHFGKGQISHLPELAESGKKVLLVYGGGSIKRTGIYDQAMKLLDQAGLTVFELSGVEPNPRIETVRKGAQMCKEQGIDMVLAIGGGSTIDCAKVVAAGALYEGDAWDLVLQGASYDCVPLGTVLTLPATGSEMNNGAVISRHETKEKFAFYSKYPVFSILDPEVTYSLPAHQIACGLADTFVHVMEQYLTKTGQSRVMDRWAEGILQTLIEIAPKIRENQQDYTLMSDFMLSATMGLNGFIALGVEQDWATHMIGHELTALHGLTHGETLAMVLPGTMSVLREQKGDKIIQFGERVMGVSSGLRESRINETIKRTEEFFRSLGLRTRLSEAGIGTETIDEIERRFNERHVHFGEDSLVDGATAKKILTQVL